MPKGVSILNEIAETVLMPRSAAALNENDTELTHRDPLRVFLLRSSDDGKVIGPVVFAKRFKPMHVPWIGVSFQHLQDGTRIPTKVRPAEVRAQPQLVLEAEHLEPALIICIALEALLRRLSHPSEIVLEHLPSCSALICTVDPIREFRRCTDL